MVVYEIKDPAAVLTTVPKALRSDISPALEVQQLHAIGHLSSKLQPGRERGGRQHRRPVPLDQPSQREVCRLLEQINQQLERQGTMIHLVLVADDDGFVIDLYDCSDQQACRVIHDISIGINDLPLLLARLTQKVGIMVDTML